MITKFKIPTKYKKNPETLVPIVPPVLENASLKTVAFAANNAMPTDSAKTTVECPKEKNSPTPSGFLPFASMILVVSSIATM